MGICSISIMVIANQLPPMTALFPMVLPPARASTKTWHVWKWSRNKGEIVGTIRILEPNQMPWIILDMKLFVNMWAAPQYMMDSTKKLFLSLGYWGSFELKTSFLFRAPDLVRLVHHSAHLSTKCGRTWRFSSVTVFFSDLNEAVSARSFCTWRGGRNMFTQSMPNITGK